MAKADTRKICREVNREDPLLNHRFVQSWSQRDSGPEVEDGVNGMNWEGNGAQEMMGTNNNSGGEAGSENATGTNNSSGGNDGEWGGGSTDKATATEKAIQNGQDVEMKDVENVSMGKDKEDDTKNGKRQSFGETALRQRGGQSEGGEPAVKKAKTVGG